MATKLVNVKLANGKEILVETDEPVTSGVKPVGLVTKGEIDFGGALDNIKSAAEQLRDTLKTIAIPPDNCEISFGVKLSASAGIILAKAGAEANFTIKMGWSSEK